MTLDSQYTSVITAFPVLPSFLSSPEMSFVYQLREITPMDYFFPGCPVSPVSLQLSWKACELPDIG